MPLGYKCGIPIKKRYRVEKNAVLESTYKKHRQKVDSDTCLVSIDDNKRQNIQNKENSTTNKKDERYKISRSLLNVLKAAQ